MTEFAVDEAISQILNDSRYCVKVHKILDLAYLIMSDSSLQWRGSVRSGNYLRVDLALMRPSTG